MRDLYNHSRNIYLITRTLEERLALLPKPKMLPAIGRLIRGKFRKQEEQVVDGFRFVDGQIRAATPRVFKDQPRRLMRVFLHAQQRGLKLHPDLAQAIRQDLSLVNREFLHDEHVRETFLEILNQRGNVSPILRRHARSGVAREIHARIWQAHVPRAARVLSSIRGGRAYAGVPGAAGPGVGSEFAAARSLRRGFPKRGAAFRALPCVVAARCRQSAEQRQSFAGRRGIGIARGEATGAGRRDDAFVALAHRAAFDDGHGLATPRHGGSRR